MPCNIGRQVSKRCRSLRCGGASSANSKGQPIDDLRLAGSECLKSQGVNLSNCSHPNHSIDGSNRGRGSNGNRRSRSTPRHSNRCIGDGAVYCGSRLNRLDGRLGDVDIATRSHGDCTACSIGGAFRLEIVDFTVTLPDDALVPPTVIVPVVPPAFLEVDVMFAVRSTINR